MANTSTMPAPRRLHRRRMSAPGTRPSPRLECRPLSLSMEALDLSSASPTQALASLRYLVLSYLADLERRLARLESPDWRAKGEHTMEDARQWARTGLEMLAQIRDDLSSHLPDVDVDSLKASLSDLHLSDLGSHLPDLHLPDMPDLGAHLPDLGALADDLGAHLPDLGALADDVRARWADLDLMPTLAARLHSLHAHLHAPVFAALLAEDDLARALAHSLDGLRLIPYAHLPAQWRNNPFVLGGYRFIPIRRYKALIRSVFKLHNESLNIHTHLLPLFAGLVLLAPSIFPSFAPSLALFPSLSPSLASSLSPSALGLAPPSLDAAERLFAAFALLCLATSVLWHTMAGCAHQRAMELCARLDYVGIGWLISISIGTIVHYGYACHPGAGAPFLALCFVMGVAGNVLPFMEWFNKVENRLWRLAFFLVLSFSALGPLAGIAALHSWDEMRRFVAPVTPSLLSYALGLFFYATQIPERFLPKHARWVDWVGGGSHAIWHVFIVLAMQQHGAGLRSLKTGPRCDA
ncbi:hemolysin-III related-domain-containing protein [Mycena sp. CBHHK59/15]|nr:hemolysin-III related-domain-containing protein [Mycena sp. CBHHK59/15]